MSAESRRVTKTEVWVGWEWQVVNGVYPLRRFLGGSNHSAVFLTEYKGASPSDVAIKLVPADGLEAEAQLVQWGTAATLSHPHLISLFDVGRCHLGGREFLFVVMEYAEQTLAQLLPKRALSPDEVRELLPPTLDTLAFLHRNQLVQGQLKPSNFLVVNDQLKLAADTVRPAGIFTSSMARNSLYDPPELTDGEVSAAGDVWSLGVTLVEALTQRPLTWDDRLETASSHVNLPAPFGDAVRRCLSRNPANRPSVIELADLCKPGPHPRVVSAPPAPVHQAPVREASVPQPAAPEEAALADAEVAPSETFRKRKRLGPGIAAVIVISLAVWVGLRLRQHHLDASQASSAASQSDLASNAASDVFVSDAAPASARPAASAGARASTVAPASAGALASARVPASTGVAASTGAPASAAAPSSPTTLSPRAPSAAAPSVEARPPTAPSAAAPSASGRSAIVSDVPAPGAARWPGARADVAASAAVPSAAAHATSAVASETVAATNARGAATPVGATPAAAAIPVAARVAADTGATTARPLQTRSDLSGTISRPRDQSSLSPATASPGVLHEAIPEVPEAIRDKIRGHINVGVRVLVDPSGDVVGQFLESAGPSRYFTRVAGDSAVEWKFAPADGVGSRVWLLRFEFARDGATVDATAAQ